MCSQTRNSCAKAFDNRSRSKNLKPKKSRGGAGQFNPPPSSRLPRVNKHAQSILQHVYNQPCMALPTTSMIWVNSGFVRGSLMQKFLRVIWFYFFTIYLLPSIFLEHLLSNFGQGIVLSVSIRQCLFFHRQDLDVVSRPKKNG